MKSSIACKTCGGIQDATRNDENEPIYTCRCCYAVTARRVYQTAKKVAKQANQDKFNDLIKELLGE